MAVARPAREGSVLKAGDMAPAITGTAYDGATYDLGAPGKRTVLFFYPKANTPG
jgi:peroxiredoxin